MARNIIALLKEGDKCIVENHAVAGSHGYDKNFTENAVVKFVMGSSVIVEFENSSNQFGSSRMTFEADGQINQIQSKKVDIRLIVTKGSPEQQQMLDDMMKCAAAIGRINIDPTKFFSQDETASRELLAQMQAIEDFLNQLYV